MKKKYIVFLVLIVLVIGVISTSVNKSKNDLKNDKELTKDVRDLKTFKTSNYLSKDLREKAQDDSLSASYVYEDTTPPTLKNEADIVAIVSVISVDGTDIEFEPSVGSTYGKLVINNVFKGEKNEGDVIDYIKIGSVMSLEEWEKGQPTAAREKREAMRKASGIDASTIFYSLHYEYDPIVEDGKTYLAYLKYNENVNKYEVIGRENGFRELNINRKDEVSSVSYKAQEYKIKNNETEKFESLDEYINKYLA